MTNFIQSLLPDFVTGEVGEASFGMPSFIEALTVVFAASSLLTFQGCLVTAFDKDLR